MLLQQSREEERMSVSSARAFRTAVPPRDPKGHREGFTTGACAAAAAKAATRVLVRGQLFDAIESTLPNGRRHTFPLERCELSDEVALCSIIKDAGDDPDCTHGAEIVAEVRLASENEIVLEGGEGVATVTKPGLGLDVGAPAINPVPRRNITEMVREELVQTQVTGARVTISVPGGEELAKQTINARLGLLGGISILGTSGIVKPYSTAAYKASVVQAIDVARRRQIDTLVLTTGGKSEAYAMRLYPQLPEDAFIQVGDFVGVGVKHCARRQARRVVVVGMIGKLSKMADGKTMTHAAGSEVNMELLAAIAHDLHAAPEVVAQIRAANTARHVLELATQSGLVGLADEICARVVQHLEHHAALVAPLAVQATLVDFDGRVLGHAPPLLLTPEMP
jgi:cobalt-precorrin-5B (C1)-methyltransferase